MPTPGFLLSPGPRPVRGDQLRALGCALQCQVLRASVSMPGMGAIGISSTSLGTKGVLMEEVGLQRGESVRKQDGTHLESHTGLQGLSDQGSGLRALLLSWDSGAGPAHIASLGRQRVDGPWAVLGFQGFLCSLLSTALFQPEACLA